MESPRLLPSPRASRDRFLALVRAHRVLTLIAALAILYGGYAAYAAVTAPPKVTRYLLSTVATDTVVATVSETGQVAAENQVELDAKALGQVVAVYVAAGEHVAAGAPIAAVDPTTEQEAVTSAEQALQASQIALSKQSVPSATADTTYNDVVSTIADLTTVMDGLDSALHDRTVTDRTFQSNLDAYENLAAPADPAVSDEAAITDQSFRAAQASLDSLRTALGSTPRSAAASSIGALAQQTYGTAQAVSQAVSNADTFLAAVNSALTRTSGQVPSTLAGHRTSVAGYATTVNGHVTALKNDLATSQSDAYDIQTSQLDLAEKQSALDTAREALADTVVRAPFSGTVGQVNVQKFQTIGNGAAVATMASDNEGVDISVNEVDAAKIKPGQKASITFDALPNVTLAGTVSSIDTVGAAAQGVVSYDAAVVFDTPNPSVLPGMSATVDIVTGTATGLAVPATAVKSANGQSYVQIFDPPIPENEVAAAGTAGVPSASPPANVPVTLGLAGDAEVIVKSGLAANAQIVTRTVSAAAASTASAPSGSNILFGGARARPGGAVIRGGG